MSTAIQTQVAARDPLLRVESDLLQTLEPLGVRGRLWIVGLVCIIAAGAYAYALQLFYGLRVTGMRDYVSWGVYMTNFVFFIGISHAGTLISAILRVTNAGWRRPITRMAEAITLFALMVGAPMVIIDMGRPDRILNVFVHGRLQSPILWDVCSIMTYITGSFLYLYIAMIPDMSTMAKWARAQHKPRLQIRLYDALSLGYRGTPEQERLLAKALGIMAVIIIPVAVSVHTVVSWIFGMTLRPGWHSTIFGPYFVVGAIFSGTAAIITAMAIFRRAYRLEEYITPLHFRNLARLLLALTLLYCYFTLSEYLTSWYGGSATDARLVALLMGDTPYGATFWLWVIGGLFVPLGLLAMPGRRSIRSIVTGSVLINIGMWIKRYLIVVPTLQTPFLSATAAGRSTHYSPTWIELTITAGAFAAFALLYTLFSRYFPIVSIWETVEDRAEMVPEAVPPPPLHGWKPGLSTWLLALAFVPLVSHGAHAQAARAQIRVDAKVEGGEKLLVASVSANGQPVVGAGVAFFIKRTFGEMTIGEDVTLTDGTAAVSFPRKLPGDANGHLRVIAQITSPDAYAGTRVETTVAGGSIMKSRADPFPRALWAPRAPLGVSITIATLLAFVWSLYVIVVVQLVKIRRTPDTGGHHGRV